MAYDQKYLRVTYLFQVYNEAEVADMGFKVSGSALYDPEAALSEIDDTFMEDLCDLARTGLFTASGFARASYSRFTGCKIAAVGTDGLYLTDPKVFEYATPLGGSATDVPPQLSVCLSLHAAESLGYGNRGRVYIPHSSGTLASDSPRLASTVAANIAAAGATWVGAVNTAFLALSAAGEMKIMSSRGSGSTKPVSYVRCGNVIDTQQRRRRQLKEVYSEHDV